MSSRKREGHMILDGRLYGYIFVSQGSRYSLLSDSKRQGKKCTSTFHIYTRERVEREGQNYFPFGQESLQF